MADVEEVWFEHHSFFELSLRLDHQAGSVESYEHEEQHDDNCGGHAGPDDGPRNGEEGGAQHRVAEGEHRHHTAMLLLFLTRCLQWSISVLGSCSLGYRVLVATRCVLLAKH